MKEIKLTTDETNEILKVVTDYTYALDVLDKYDHQVLEIEDMTTEEFFQITYDEAMKAFRDFVINLAAALYLEMKKTNLFRGRWLPFIKPLMDKSYIPA
jgi:valyl-tRNA synthetase